MANSESTDNIFAAIDYVQRNCPPITLDSQGYGYRYASLANTVQTVMPILRKAGLLHFYNVEEARLKCTVLLLSDPTQQLESTLDLLPIADSLATNQVDPQVLASIVAKIDMANQQNVKTVFSKMSGKMTYAQGLGSAITYARRYLLTSMLGLVTEEDNDGNNKPLDL